MHRQRSFLLLGNSLMDVPSYCNEKFLIFPVLFLISFVAPSASAVPASSASMSSTALHKCRSFGPRHPLHNCLAILVEEMQSLLAVLGVSIVPGGQFILQVHLQISMLGADLPQESVGKVALFVILTCDFTDLSERSVWLY